MKILTMIFVSVVVGIVLLGIFNGGRSQFQKTNNQFNRGYRKKSSQHGGNTKRLSDVSRTRSTNLKKYKHKNDGNANGLSEVAEKGHKKFKSSKSKNGGKANELSEAAWKESTNYRGGRRHKPKGEGKPKGTAGTAGRQSTNYRKHVPKGRDSLTGEIRNQGGNTFRNVIILFVSLAIGYYVVFGYDSGSRAQQQKAKEQVKQQSQQMPGLDSPRARQTIEQYNNTAKMIEEFDRNSGFWEEYRRRQKSHEEALKQIRGY